VVTWAQGKIEANAAIATRRSLVWELRVQGHTIPAIRNLLIERGLGDWNLATLYADLDASAREAQARFLKQGGMHRGLELARLDALYVAWYPYGSSGQDFYAGQMLLKIMDLRIKVLGLDRLPVDDAQAQDRPLAQLSQDELQARLQQAQAQLGAGESLPDEPSS
jgi:hypothetical protein